MASTQGSSSKVLFVAMESDYDGAWIYGIFDVLSTAMMCLREVRERGPKYSLKDRYMFIEEWPLGGGKRLATHDYTEP
jgi:hypothetical protein